MGTDRARDKYIGCSWDELLEENQNLNALVQNAPGGVMCCEADLEEGLALLEYSDGFLRLLGYTAQELKEKFDNKFRYMIYEPDWEQTIQSVQEQMSRGSTKKIEYRVRCGDGSLKMIYDQGQLVHRNGRDIFYCILSDVTEQRAVTEELRLSLERHQIIMEQTSDIIFEWDIENDSILWSDNWEKKFGYKPFQMGLKQRIKESGNIQPDDKATLISMFCRLMDNTSYAEDEVRIQKQDGGFLWCRIRASLQLDAEGNKKKVIGIIMDIDSEKQKAQMLKERAEKDALTGIYNKGTVQMLADKYIAGMKEGEAAAFFMIDIDDFKYINDVYGHLSGDVILTEIAAGLRKTFRSNDIIGRIGGDEFAVIMKDITSKEIVSQKAEEVVQIFGHLIEGENTRFSGSIGIAFLPDNGCDFGSVYKNADIALYKAKAAGKDTWRIYENGLQMEDFQGTAYTADRRPDVSEEVWHGGNGLATYIFSSLYEAVNVKKGIEDILKIIGTQFAVSRAYIFECSEDGNLGYNTFEWCQDGIDPQKENLQGVTETASGGYYSHFNEEGVFYSRNISELEEPLRSMLDEQGIKSMLLCLIMDKGKKCGFIGFDECEVNRFWTKEQIDTLTVSAQIISVFLRKERIQAELRCLKEEENCKQ